MKTIGRGTAFSSFQVVARVLVRGQRELQIADAEVNDEIQPAVTIDILQGRVGNASSSRRDRRARQQNRRRVQRSRIEVRRAQDGDRHRSDGAEVDGVREAARLDVDADGELWPQGGRTHANRRDVVSRYVGAAGRPVKVQIARAAGSHKLSVDKAEVPASSPDAPPPAS